MATTYPNPSRVPFLRRLFPGRTPALAQEKTVLSSTDTPYSVNPNSSNEILFLHPDEIIRQKGWRELKTVRHDESVKLALHFRKLLVYGRQYDIEPHKEEGAKEAAEQDLDIARFVSWNLKRLNMSEVWRNALTAYEYGFSTAELNWELTEWEGQKVIALASIKHRDPEFMDIFCDIRGDITHFRQRTSVSGATGAPLGYIDVMPGKMWHFAHNREFQNNYGVSDIRAIYRNWWAKKFIIQFWNTYLEQYSSPTRIAKYPTGAPQQLKDAIKEILKSVTTKTEIMVPEGVDFTLLEALRGGQASYDEAVAYNDRAIMRGLFLPGIYSETARAASEKDAQGRLQLKMIFKAAQASSDELNFSFEKQVVRRLVAYNFETENYPCGRWADYGEYEAFEITDAIRLLFNAGLLDADQEDVNFCRGLLGLPLREEGDEDEVLRPNPAPIGQSSAPSAAGQGNDLAAKGGSTKTT